MGAKGGKLIVGSRGHYHSIIIRHSYRQNKPERRANQQMPNQLLIPQILKNKDQAPKGHQDLQRTLNHKKKQRRKTKIKQSTPFLTGNRS